MESIVEIVAKHSIEQPERLCLVDNENELTYEEYFRSIFGFAKYLESIGIKKGDVILVKAKQSVYYLISGLSVQLIGAIFVPLEKTISDVAVKETLCLTNAMYIITDNNYDYECRYISYLEIKCNIWRDCIPYKEIKFPKSRDTAEILFTTGTTGKSKGIELTHESVVAVSENVMYGVDMKENNVELIPVPLSHSHGLRRYYANMLNGSTVVITDGVVFIDQVFRMMNTYCVTSIDLVPAMLAIILRLSKDRLGEYVKQLDYVQIGTAKLNEKDKEKLRELLPGVRLYDFYGSTEAGCSCILEFSKNVDKKQCIGMPTCNSYFMFVDENGDQIKTSSETKGLIASGGAMIMKGYYKDEVLTSKVLKNGYVFSSDEGYLGEDGFIYLTGRNDAVINIAGKKVNPEEIEEKIMEHECVLDCACVPINDKIAGQVTKLFVVLKEDEEISSIALYDYLSSRLEDYKIPQIIEEVKKIPRSINGKILRKTLSEN